jgi:hypothetical protein
MLRNLPCKGREISPSSTHNNNTAERRHRSARRHSPCLNRRILSIKRVKENIRIDTEV